MRFIKHILLSVIATLLMHSGFAQEHEQDAYAKVIMQRADKIVQTLDISDAEKAVRVRNIIVDQYGSLSAIHDARDAKIHVVKENKELPDEKKDQQIAKVEQETLARLEILHNRYLMELSRELTPEKVDKVKDGMTYGVLPLTYNGYLEMIPSLSEEEKKKIMDYLMEAREHAMDAGSSEEKHRWFGKYKGRINNYLSDAGYDLKKAGQDWEERRQAAKKNN